MRGAPLALGALVAAFGVSSSLHDSKALPCPGWSEPVPAPDVIARVWKLPIVQRPVVLGERWESSWMMSYSPAGQKTLELGPFVAIEHITRNGNGAHTLGPDFVELSLEPKEGDWAPRYQNAVDKPEYYPIDLELRRDDRTGLFVIVVLNGCDTKEVPALGVRLPPRPPGTPTPGPLAADAGFVFRVVHHAAGHRFHHAAWLISGGVAWLLATALATTARQAWAAIAAFVCFAFAAALFALSWIH